MEGVNTEQKLIKTVNMSAETTEFDTLVADVRAKTESAGGYVENSDVGGDYGMDMTRYAYLVLRIPADKLDDFVGEVKNASNVRTFMKAPRMLRCSIQIWILISKRCGKNWMHYFP